MIIFEFHFFINYKMKTLSQYILFFSLTLLSSCREEVEKPKVIYNSSNNSIKITKVDSTQIKIADLPIQLDGTKYLIYPIGDMNIYDGKSKSSYGSTSIDKGSFTVSNYSENEIAGYLSNLKFQEIGKDSITSLTDKPILIERITYLKSVSDKTKQQILVYSLTDLDTNKDGKLDSNDIKTLYLSTINGVSFTKISADFQELIDWNLIESTNRLYFRTIEDTNKNGQFDKKDVVHYQFVDLSNKAWKVVSYQPI